MTEKKSSKSLEALVNHFKKVGNFDHLDMNEVAKIGEQYGVTSLEAGEAFFIAREQASLRENEILDGGSGEESDKVPLYGKNSIHNILFGKKK